jgi:tripartite-type tricarboxylate transporter receptor subunit TctC
MKRNPLFPDCPTFVEEGYDIVWGSFNTIATTAGTPESTLKILEEAFDKAYHDPGFLDWTRTTGVEATWMDSQETAEYIAKTVETYNGIMDELVAAGIVEE